MVAIQYIIGQLNAPIEQMIGFIQSWQLARLSLDRLNEIRELKDEEGIIFTDSEGRQNYNHRELSTIIPSNHTIELAQVSFKYSGAGNELVLNNIDLLIPQGKITAIVGASGSGKTTLLKLLLKFYDSYAGTVTVGGNNVANISHRSWRKSIGVVMQDSYIFSDTIAANISVSDERPTLLRLREAAAVANVLEFIESLPLGFYTRIGLEGQGISAGQKQRILIARAVYKDPDYIFLDEATNSLDANNEMIIIKNLEHFFKNKTVIVVAHRLSTVKHADNIVVLNNGIISESGTHLSLAEAKGEYYTLVKNQLELGQ
jgi:ATP-binding cassette subfamily B protein